MIMDIYIFLQANKNLYWSTHTTYETTTTTNTNNNTFLTIMDMNNKPFYLITTITDIYST